MDYLNYMAHFHSPVLQNNIVDFDMIISGTVTSFGRAFCSMVKMSSFVSVCVTVFPRKK